MYLLCGKNKTYLMKEAFAAEIERYMMNVAGHYRIDLG